MFECHEQLFSGITVENAPSVLGYAREIKQCMLDTRLASLIVVFEMKTVGQLEEFWDLYKLGVLNKIMEKEIMSPERVAVMKSVALKDGIEIQEVTVSTEVNKVDYDKCKAWLTQKQDIVYPHDPVEAILIQTMVEEMHEHTEKSLIHPTAKEGMSHSQKSETDTALTSSDLELSDDVKPTGPSSIDIKSTSPPSTYIESTSPPSTYIESTGPSSTYIESTGPSSTYIESAGPSSTYIKPIGLFSDDIKPTGAIQQSGSRSGCVRQNVAQCMATFRRHVLPSLKQSLCDPLLMSSLRSLARKLLGVVEVELQNIVCFHHILENCQDFHSSTTTKPGMEDALHSLAFIMFRNYTVAETETITINKVGKECQVEVTEESFQQYFEKLGMFQPLPKIDRHLKIPLEQLMELNVLKPTHIENTYRFASPLYLMYLLTHKCEWNVVPTGSAFSFIHLFASFSGNADLSLDKALERYLCQPKEGMKKIVEKSLQTSAYLPVMDLFLTSTPGFYGEGIESSMLQKLQSSLSHSELVTHILKKDEADIKLNESDLKKKAWPIMLKAIRVSDFFYSERKDKNWLVRGKSLKRSLHLDGVSLNDDSLMQVIENLHFFPTLSKLNLENNNITAQSVSLLLQVPQLSSLTCLILKDNIKIGLSELTRPLGLEFLPNLLVLDMEGCNLKDSGMEIIAIELKHLKKLKEYYCPPSARKPLDTEGSYTLASLLHSLPYLEILNICECLLGDVGMSVVMRSISSRYLKKLNLRENKVGAGGSNVVFELLSQCHCMEHLDYSDNEITSMTNTLPRNVTLKRQSSEPKVHEKFISAMTASKTWDYLSLWKCNIGGLATWFATPENTASLSNLTYICLQENNISDDMTIDLASCLENGFENLEHLNLRENNISNKGAVRLSYSLREKAYLSTLLLDRNEIESEGLLAILKFVEYASRYNLKELDISYNSVTIDEKLGIVEEMEAETTQDDKEILMLRVRDTQITI
ncbi:hypothetical protein ScPMuIL_016366 [Solemya velum]